MTKTLTGKIKQSPKRPAEQRRRQLLAAARYLFMKRGVKETTTEQIARKAGLTKGALYFHFHNKEEILFDLVQNMHREMIAAIERVPGAKASPVMLLRALLGASPEASTAEFDNYLDFWSQASKVPRIRRFLRSCHEEYQKVFVERIDHSFAPTQRDREDLAVMILAMNDGLTVRKMLGDTEVDFPRQLRLFAALIRGRTDNREIN
ncbi:MAG: TetR/AcrR family transcriptional regulator [Candidatus Zixiibacteriota bacterium]